MVIDHPTLVAQAQLVLTPSASLCINSAKAAACSGSEASAPGQVSVSCAPPTVLTDSVTVLNLHKSHVLSICPAERDMPTDLVYRPGLGYLYDLHDLPSHLFTHAEHMHATVILHDGSYSPASHVSTNFTNIVACLPESDRAVTHSKIVLDGVDLDAPLEVLYKCFYQSCKLPQSNLQLSFIPPTSPLDFKDILQQF